MTVKELIDSGLFMVLNYNEEEGSREISRVFCCDLLSVAMSKAPVGACWVTIMGNINTLAVASLTDCACVVLAEGTALEDSVVTKAQVQGITLLKTDMPIFDAGLKVHAMLAD